MKRTSNALRKLTTRYMAVAQQRLVYQRQLFV
jgi:hypothetical protein